MARDSKNRQIAIIGAGAAGCICAYHILKLDLEVTLFDKGTPLRTLLPTGGGRCNLAHAEYNTKDLANNYPRGEKFLYSVFSQFSTCDTIELFESMGIKTYIQENGRIFPESNSAKRVRETILEKIKRAQIINEEVTIIRVLNNGFALKTNKGEYYYTDIVLATGGHSGYKLAQNLGINTTETRPSLVGLNTEENFNELSGTSLKKVSSNGFCDDLLFTHFGLSGPLIYSISSINAFKKFPYEIEIDLCPELVDLQKELNTNPHKEIKNILNKFLPLKVVNYILKEIDPSLKAHKINGKTRDSILNKIHHFKVNIVGTNLGEETVTAGGIDLNQINPKTMEVKTIPNLYCIGEVLNIDGFCGGFNLQNAWSTAFVCSQALTS